MSTTTIQPFAVETVRADFPILKREVNGVPLVYLDNGASAQKPKAVIDTVSHYYAFEHTNIHRGVHRLSQDATAKYEAARDKVQVYLNAAHNHEIIWTKGTTDGINLVASTFGRSHIQRGDEVIISAMEHHSNIVPWQMICEERGATLKVIPINDAGDLLMDEYRKLLSEKTKLVSICHVSNSLGTVNPVREIIAEARKYDAAVHLDGAQALPHMKVDVQELDVDFYTFSGHKVFGPTGTGVLYGKTKWLEALPPYQGGGDMIKEVTFEKTTYNDLPHKFEAGTPNIAGGIGMGAAIDYLNALDYEGLRKHELALMDYATAKLKAFDGLRFIGEAKEKEGVLSFVIDGLHHYDVGILLDRKGVAVRTGHHCTQPLMKRFDITGTIRASLAFYNNHSDIDQLVDALQYAIGRLK